MSGIITDNVGRSTGLIKAAAGGGGKIIQIVSTNESDVFSASAATTAVTTAAISVAITPTLGTSSVWIMCTCWASHQSAGGTGIHLYKDGSLLADANADAASARSQGAKGLEANEGGDYDAGFSTMFIDATPGTSEYTYDIRIGHSSGSTKTCYLNRTSADGDNGKTRRSTSQLYAIEIGA